MLTVWGKTIMAEVGQIVDALRVEVESEGLLRNVRDIGSDVMVTCTQHKGGQERKPSMGIKKDDQYDPTTHRTVKAGQVHCFTCGYTADLPKWVADVLGLKNAVLGMAWLMERFTYGIDGDRAEIVLDMNRVVPATEFVPNNTVNDLHRQFYGSAAERYMMDVRGISAEICDRFRLGYDSENNAVAFPITDAQNRTQFIKYRGITDRVFRNPSSSKKTGALFGMGVLAQEMLMAEAMGNSNTQQVWLCEGETDCLTLWQRGKWALGIMGSGLSKEQAKLIYRQGIIQVVCALDNDTAGKTGNKQIREILTPMGIRTYSVAYNSGKKDWNDTTEAEFSAVTVF